MHTAMFTTMKDLAKFYARPQDVSYVGEPYEMACNFYIKFNADGVTQLEAIKRRVSNAGGVLLSQ